MRILVLAINYAPEAAGNAPYTTGLCEFLASQGHEVHVLTGQPHYPSWRREQTLPAEELRAGVHLHRRWHYVPKRQSALHRAAYEASFLTNARHLIGLPRPDAVVGVVPSLSDGVLARIASRRFDVPYGLIFQDLMGRASAQSGVKGGRQVQAYVTATESWIARGASSLAIVAEGFRPYVESLGVAPEDIMRVRNWTTMPSVSEEREETRERLGWQTEHFVCLHAGNMGLKQGLEVVVDAARLANDCNSDLRFVLMGNGNQREALEARARGYGLGNLDFLPGPDQQSYIDTLAAADALVLSLNADVTDMAFPSKLSSYVAVERPIVASVARDSEVGRELEISGAALLIEPGRPEHLYEGIVELSQQPLLQRSLIHAARTYGKQAFDRNTALAELESFVYRITGSEILRPVARTLQEAA